MLRKTAVLLTLQLFSMATQVHALELGSVTVESALNQPLQVRIEVIQLGATRLEDVNIQMASQDVFVDVGIDRVSFLSNIRFDVVADNTGNYVVLSTNQIVQDPSLSFVLETRWPSGRQLSMHTVSLDLPVFNDQGVSQRVQQPVSPVLSPPSSNSSSAASAASEEIQTISTSAANSLSEIAVQVRPNESVTVEQTMLAIQELNPDAFNDGNINRMRSGEILRVPNLVEVQAIDPREAVTIVNRQNRQVDVEPLAAPVDAEPGQSAPQQGQLSLIIGDPGAINASELSDAENDELDRRVAELENQLALSQEEADRARIEREELDSRLEDLESQIDSAQEILRLQDLQLAQLQESLVRAAEEVVATEARQAALAAERATAEQPIARSPSLLDDILRIVTSNTLMLIIAVGLIVSLLVSLLLRRNRANKPDDDELDELAEKEFDDASNEGDSEYSNGDEAVTEETGPDDVAEEVALAFDIDGGDDTSTNSEKGEAQAQEDREKTIDDEATKAGFSPEGSVVDDVEAVSFSADVNSDSGEVFNFDLDEIEIESVAGIEEVEMLSDDEEVATKLELAYAYQKMGDVDGAKEILREVISEGTREQMKEAKTLLETIDQVSD
jgi:pilus assembly protein FimV